MFKSHNLENLHYLEPKSHTQVIFSNSKNIDFEGKDIIFKDNKYYINLETYEAKIKHYKDRFSKGIDQLSSFIRDFFNENKEGKLFFSFDKIDNYSLPDLAYIIFNGINEGTFFEQENQNKIGLDKKLKDFEDKILKISDEYYDYATFYNKSHLILDKQLNSPFLYEYKKQAITSVLNNDIEPENSLLFVEFFNNLEGNEVLDPRLDKNHPHHINIEDYFNIVREKYFNDLRISVDRSNPKNNGDIYKIKVYDNNNEVIDTFQIDFNYETIHITNNEIFNKLKDELNEIHSTTYKLENNTKENSSSNILGSNNETNKETLRHIYSLINEGKVSKLEINETTPIQGEIKDILIEHFSNTIDLSLTKPQQKTKPQKP